MNFQSGTRRLLDPRIIKFLFAGIINTIFGYAVYAILIFVNLPYLTALFVATVAGVIFNYFSFGRMVFSSQGGWQVFARFVIAYSVVYVINAFLLMVLTKDFYFNPYVGQVICLPLSVLLSWLLMNRWVYKKD
jgi:putative flippase GtrA